MAISWQASKPGSKRLTGLATEMLRIELGNDAISRGVFLLTAHGRPFASSRSLHDRGRTWIVWAEITDTDGKATRAQHGARKGVAEVLAGSGASQCEIMTARDHSELRTFRACTEKT